MTELFYPTFKKYSTAVLDYKWDFEDYLESGETITSASTTADSGITIDSTTSGSSAITVWLSGGTSKEDYKVGVHIHTSLDREDDRYFNIEIL